jgi:hypothetical protein
MKHLLIETQQHELKVDEAQGNSITLGGVFSQWDQLNNNKRVYQKESLLREVGKLKQLVEAGRLLGELDHPQTPRVNLDRVSHKITNLKEDEGSKTVHGTIELLSTPNGKIAKAIVDSGTKLAISSRATGELKENDDGTFTVGEDLNMITYDVVLQPGVESAILGIQESEDYIVLTKEEFSQITNGKFSVADEKSVKERMKRIREESLIRAVEGALKG